MLRARIRRLHNLFPAMILAACMAAPATAGDGRFELNHEAALKGIPAIGDSTPGYPITINQPGSYILTGDLLQSDPWANVVEITADDVSIDLNGFAIRGNNTCSAVFSGSFLSSVDCDTPGLGKAIHAVGQYRITIHDGIITGISSTGVEIAGGIVRDVQFDMIGGTCLYVSGKATVVNVHAELCDAHCIHLVLGRIDSSFCRHAQASGFYTGLGSIVSESVVRSCGSYGINTSYRVVVQDCAVTSNDASGVRAGSGTSIINCLVAGNNGYGIEGGTNPAGYAGNMILENVTGTVSGSGMIETGTNVCGTNTTCP